MKNSSYICISNLENMRRIQLFLSFVLLSVSIWAQDNYVFPEDVKPLILTRWGQNYPFNLLCPKTTNENGENTNMKAGCGSVAMAQIVNYHQYPAMSPDKAYEYNWDMMYPTVTIDLRREEIVAVAKLISDCGVSSLTDYGEKTSQTSISKMMGALKRLFSYSNYMAIYERSQFTTPLQDSLYRQLIFNELKARRPVLYRAYSEKEKGGHLFIIDGCRGRKVHVNMGWAGDRDGYYDLDDLSGYSQQQWLLVGVADTTYKAETKEMILTEPGTLKTILDSHELLTTQHIKLSGKMDRSDFSTLRQMLKTGLLRTIDMEQVDLEQLPDSAFFECTYLSHFVAPRTMQNTGQWSFCGCRNLNRIVFHEGLRAIGNASFMGCSNLLRVELPSTTTQIGHNAFTSCSTLLSVTLPEGIQKVGHYAFSYCNHLYSIKLPKTLRSIGKEVFKSCERLTHVHLDKENPYFVVDEHNELKAIAQ
jgi:hypothetical protein